jgi:hypothetical protein
MSNFDIVVIDVTQEYFAFQCNNSFKLSQANIHELFHQIFESMFDDAKIYLNKLLTLPNFIRLFGTVPNQMDQAPFKELFASIAMELFFKIHELGMFNTVNGNKIEFFLIRIDNNTAYLRRCFN